MYSPLCRACLVANEIVAHVLLVCTSVATQQAQFLGSPLPTDAK